MVRLKIVLIILGVAAVTTATLATLLRKKTKRTTYKANLIEEIPVRKMGFYEKYLKRDQL